MILNNHRVKLIEILDTLKISKQRVGYIIHENLGIGKVVGTAWAHNCPKTITH